MMKFKPHYSHFIFLLFSLVLMSCGRSSSSTKTWKTIEIGDYLIDFPSDFKLIKKKGIDSYVGEIKGDSMTFYFDFGYYSNDFEQTPEEYIKNGDWKTRIPYELINFGAKYDQNTLPKYEVTEIKLASGNDSTIPKGCDFVAVCWTDSFAIDYAVVIPDRIKSLNFKVDTVGNTYRKIVYSKKPMDGITGIYLMQLNKFNESINASLALSVSTGGLTKNQQELALKIFETARLK